MSLGTYGTNTLANVDPRRDIQIFYNYRPSRNSVDITTGEQWIEHANPSAMLQKVTTNDGSFLNGMYNLVLDLTIFNAVGFYSILIQPREIFGTIIDSPAVLSANPSIRGIVIRHPDFDGLPIDDMGLTGFKVNYFNAAGIRLPEFRIITSNGLVEPIAANLSSSQQKAISYRYVPSSNLIFMTVSPSSAPVAMPQAIPNLGVTGQMISIQNSFFNPTHLEVEMTDSDISTITSLLSGNQALNLDNGILTSFDRNQDIINQVELFQKKDSNNRPLYELRRRLDNIVRTESHENIFGGV